MYLKATLVWFAILILAFLNGALRQFVLIPRLGPETGHVLSTLLLSILVLLVAWVALPWLSPPSTGTAILIGLLWLTLTLAFEFLAGHYLFKHSWDVVLADYNLAKGRIWVLVPIVTLLAPWLVRAVRTR